MSTITLDLTDDVGRKMRLPIAVSASLIEPEVPEEPEEPEVPTCEAGFCIPTDYLIALPILL